MPREQLNPPTSLPMSISHIRRHAVHGAFAGCPYTVLANPEVMSEVQATKTCGAPDLNQPLGKDIV
jgi:hypothetical protein